MQQILAYNVAVPYLHIYTIETLGTFRRHSVYDVDIWYKMETLGI